MALVLELALMLVMPVLALVLVSALSMLEMLVHCFANKTSYLVEPLK